MMLDIEAMVYSREAEDRVLDLLENTLLHLRLSLELGHIDAAMRLVHDAEGLLAMYRWE